MPRGTLLFLLLTLFTVDAVRAQDAQDPMVTGILAFREGRFDQAAASFERAVRDDGQNAEAHFLLARVYFETPLKDNKRAGKELDRALEIEPENVQYLVARMQQYRSDTNNFFSEKIQEAKRQDLARTILKLDATNAFAHEELGLLYIRDFWRYRNAIMFPTMVADQNSYRSDFQQDTAIGGLDDPLNPGTAVGVADVAFESGLENLPIRSGLDPNAVFLGDQFDVESLRAQGVPVQDLSGRAQRAFDRAVGHLKAALESDPRHRSIYDKLMEIYALKGEWKTALTDLDQMYVFFPEDAKLWTYLGLAHYRDGNLETAAKAFESSFRYMTEEEQAAYASIEYMLPDAERKAYAVDPAAYASKYWTSQDPLYLTGYNERKIEHYSRITYADLLYGSTDLDLRGWNTERGRILIRYGVPRADVVILPQSMGGSRRGLRAILDPSPELSGESAAITAAREGTSFDIAAAANTYNVWDYGDFRFVFEDPFRNGEFRMYSPSATDIAGGMQPWLNDYTIIAKETFRSVPERYDFEPVGRRIELPYLVSTFRGADGKTDVLVNYGLPITEFQNSGDLINITANSGTFVVGADRNMLAERRRTIYGLRTNQIMTFEDANIWVNSEELTVPPGKADVSVEFETTSKGTVAVQRRAVDVPDFSGSELLLSDILLAYRIEDTPDGRPLAGSDVVRSGLSIMPAPWSVFSHRQPIYLFYEVYNLTLGTDGSADYEVEAALVPKEQGSRVGRLVRGVFGGGKRGVSVRLPNRISATEDGQYLMMDAANQEPGLYTLQLKINDRVAGRSAERSLDLFLE